MSFLVGSAWTREELVFTSATSGSISEATAYLEEVPTKLRLRIDGSDNWNFEKIRLTHLSSSVSIMPKRERACQDLTLVAVSGTLCQTSLEGLYEYLQQWDDKPAYAKTDGSRFIYYLSSNGKWYFSDTLGSTTINARVVSSDADVSGIAATWQEYCNSAWTDSGGLSLQDVTHVAVSGTLCQSSLEGLYEYLQQWGDKPAYVKTDGSRFIYYLSSYGKWYFSDTLGSTTINARVVSSAEDVLDIVATWQEYCNNDWTDSGGLALQGDVSWVDTDGIDCSDYVANNYCEDSTVGSGWNSGWGPFSNFAAGGMDASEACCECGRRGSTMSADWLDDSQTSREWKLYGFPYWKSLGSSHKEECTITAGAGVMPQFVFSHQHCAGRDHFMWLGAGSASTAAQCAAIVLGRPDCGSKQLFIWAGVAGADGNCGCFKQGSLEDCVWQDPAVGDVDLHFLLQPEGQVPEMEVKFENTGASKNWLQSYNYALTAGGRLLTKAEAANHLTAPLTGSSQWVAIVDFDHPSSGFIMAGTDSGAAVGSTNSGSLSSNYVLFMAPTYSLKPSAQDTCVRPTRCTFPFEYNQKAYGQCTMQHRPGRFWCGLVQDVDYCLSTIDTVSAMPNFKFKKDLKCTRPGHTWLNPGGSAPYSTASAAMCAQFVLENPACRKDAFEWAGEGDLNCGCWLKSYDEECIWEKNTLGTLFFELEAVQDLDTFERGKDICWTDCDPYDAPSAVNSNCSTCSTTALDLHTSALSQLSRSYGVEAWGQFAQLDAERQPVWWPDGNGLTNAVQGECSSGWQVASRGRIRTDLACCSSCPGGTSFCYSDCSCMCASATSCDAALENGQASWCLSEHGCETINGACVSITGRTGAGDSVQGFVAFNQHFLDAGRIALNLQSDGGFTLVAVVRFRSAGAWERIIDFGSDGGITHDEVYISRSFGSSKLRFHISSPAASGVACEVESDDGTIVEGEWMTIVARYSAAMNSVDLLKDGRSASWRSTYGAPKKCVAPVEDRTVPYSYIGKSLWSGDAYLTADIQGIHAVSQYLDDAVAAAIGESLRQGYGNACCGPALPVGPAACHQCPDGKYHWGVEYSKNIPTSSPSALVADSPSACVDDSVLRTNDVVHITSLDSCLSSVSFRHAGYGLRTEGMVAYGSTDDRRNQVISYLAAAAGCVSVSECQGLSTAALVSRCRFILAPQLRSDGKGVFGSTLYSPAKTHRLTMQGDGNLVLYQEAGTGPAALWNSGTQAGTGVFRAILQDDGNFVRYHRDGTNIQTTTWASMTPNLGEYTPHALRVGNDGRWGVLTCLMY